MCFFFFFSTPKSFKYITYFPRIPLNFKWQHWIECILETKPTVMRCHQVLAACDLTVTQFIFWHLNSSKSPHVFVANLFQVHFVICMNIALFKIKFLQYLRHCLLELVWPPSWSISCILNESDPLVTPISLRHTRTLYTMSCSWLPDAVVQWKWNVQG